MSAPRPRLRPRFVLPSELSPDAASARLEDLLHCQDGRLIGQSVKHHMMFALRDKTHHFWSPWLQLEVRSEIGQGQTRVYGRFSPSPSIWMGFVMTYLGLATLSLFAVTFAVSQWMLDLTPSALWVVPLCAGVALTMWIATRVGQGMAAEEMAALQQAVEECLAP